MTYYNYVSEMQQLCFRATQALDGLGKIGTQDFYAAAEVGFAKLLEDANSKPVSEISHQITKDQADTLNSTREFVAQQEEQAAWACRCKEARNG